MKRALQLVQHVAESSKRVKHDLSFKLPKMKESVKQLMFEFMEEDELYDTIL